MISGKIFRNGMSYIRRPIFLIVHEKRKENGHYRQEVEIVYNFIGAVEIPDFLEDDEYDGLNC